jgi:hypothetical protein
MRSFSVGNGRLQTLTYTSDSRSLVVDLRGEPQSHPWIGFKFRPTTELMLFHAFDWGCGPISAVAVSSDGFTCAAGTETGQVIVWDRE